MINACALHPDLAGVCKLDRSELDPEEKHFRAQLRHLFQRCSGRLQAPTKARAAIRRPFRMGPLKGPAEPAETGSVRWGVGHRGLVGDQDAGAKRALTPGVRHRLTSEDELKRGSKRHAWPPRKRGGQPPPRFARRRSARVCYAHTALLRRAQLCTSGARHACPPVGGHSCVRFTHTHVVVLRTTAVRPTKWTGPHRCRVRKTYAHVGRLRLLITSAEAEGPRQPRRGAGGSGGLSGLS